MSNASSRRRVAGSSSLSEGELDSESCVGRRTIATIVGVVVVSAVDMDGRNDRTRRSCNSRGDESGRNQGELDGKHYEEGGDRMLEQVLTIDNSL